MKLIWLKPRANNKKRDITKSLPHPNLLTQPPPAGEMPPLPDIHSRNLYNSLIRFSPATFNDF
ncbi:MAG: hypothetical protein QOG23_3878 [Blastocatellia bacterium]|jgi:hypothetical protein|nr:hypothetical protein [Blastocatellia bacterium]